MHEEPTILLRQAIKHCLPVLQPLVGQFAMEYQVKRKEGVGRWRGTTELRPDIGKVFHVAEAQIKDAGVAFGESFIAWHPDHGGTIGFGGNTSNWAKNKGNIVRSALGSLWHKYRTFDVDDAAVDALVQEVSDFVNSPTVRLRFQAQLINFRLEGESFELSTGLVIRRLSEEEVSEHHGGPISTIGFVRPQWHGPYEFVVEGEFDEPKLLGDNHPESEMISEHAKRILDKTILCLRTFKEGPIGYDYVHFRPTKFCPLGLFSVGCGDKYIPFGSYSLSEADILPLTNHAKLIFACKEKSMEMACSRLADAENRTRPEDRIVDAVIGMESLLLAGVAKEDRRGELSFRFSLNYSMIFKAPHEKHLAYKVARDLYGLRSTIAHGSTLEESNLKVAGENLNLDAAGRKATTVLRTIIKYFISQNGVPYKSPEFWQRRYFGYQENDTPAT